MKLLKVDTLEEAREKLLWETADKTVETERVPFARGLGRVLAENLKAEQNIPHFRKSTVDGYAVRAADTQGVTESIPVFLDVTETIRMGMAPRGSIEAGQAAYVPTGGMVPDGADAMVMVEYCEAFDDRSIAVYDAVSAGRNVIQEGEDVRESRILLKKGSLLRPQEIGVMAAAGIREAEVFKPWKLTVISTGDELVDVDENPAMGQTRDINTYSVSAAAVKHGMEVIDTRVLRDDPILLETVVKEAMKKSDVVVVSGGSSQGEKDHTAAVMDSLAKPGVFTHGIALKPGKPTILGYDRESETVLMGLPGHPAAALMVFELLAAWLYRQRTGRKEPEMVIAEITENVAAAGGRATCLPVELQPTDSGLYKAVPIFGKSGVMTTLTKADGYTIMETNREGMHAGQRIKVILF